MIKIESNKHGATGKIEVETNEAILNYHIGGISGNITYHPAEEDVTKMGIVLLNAVENALFNNNKDPELHHWFIVQEGTDLYAIGNINGIVFFYDGELIKTDKIAEIKTNFEKGYVHIITANNREYYCPMADCDFLMQNKIGYNFSGFDEIKRKYANKEAIPSNIPDDSVLIMISDYDYYRVNKMIVKSSDHIYDCETYQTLEVGTGIRTMNLKCVNLPIDIQCTFSSLHMDIVSANTDNKPLFIENIGFREQLVFYGRHKYTIQSGERKEITLSKADIDY